MTLTAYLAILHLYFPFGEKKKVIMLFRSSLPLTFLYTGHTLARKKVGAFISLEDLFVYCRVAFSTAI